jgi:hypothetical protein
VSPHPKKQTSKLRGRKLQEFGRNSIMRSFIILTVCQTMGGERGAWAIHVARIKEMNKSYKILSGKL